ncbi:MAG: hypothetical protein FIB01_06440 [Gemmatimonadetes bacterium]|nr:hypothetical protein [Gemmatimonadota bacterium]
MSEPAAPSAGRRADDAAIILYGDERDAAHGIAEDLRGFQPTPEQLQTAAVLIDAGSGQALVVPAADAHVLPRGDGGEELKARAAALVQALRRERDWIRRRLQMPDFLLGYADALQAAGREAEVYEALRGTSVPVVGAYTAVAFVRVGTGADAPFHPIGDPALPLALAPLPGETVRSIQAQRLVTRAEVGADPDGPFAPLGGLLQATFGAQLLCAPVAADAVLVLVERRRERLMTGEDRDLLAALVRQAESALRRIRSERQVGALLGIAPAD